MSTWCDQGVILSNDIFGDSDAIITVLTIHHGVETSLVKGGKSKRLRGFLQVGNTVSLEWKARLQEQLGVFVVEPVVERVAEVWESPEHLRVFTAVCASLKTALPDRGPLSPHLYNLTTAVLDILVTCPREWQADYLRWELACLSVLGFGLDVSGCAVTGQSAPLRYVSPKTGRAVTAEGAGSYADRLLPLPAFLAPGNQQPPDAQDLKDGWRLLDHFWTHHVFAEAGRPAPPARDRLAVYFSGV